MSLVVALGALTVAVVLWFAWKAWRDGG